MSKCRLNEALVIASIAVTSMFGGVAHGQSDSADVASPSVPSEASTVSGSMARRESVTALVYSDFVSHVDRGDVREVMIAGSSVTGKLMDGTRFRTFVPDDPAMIASLLKHGVRVAVAPADGSSASDGFMTNWLPMALLVTVTIFMMSRGSFRGGGAATFGHSRAQLLTKTSRLITFADVAGIEEAQQELVEIVQYLKDPPKFQRLGAKVPRGVLLVGPPGTGKTLLARAVAGEAGVPFFTISGSDFVEMFIGVGAARVRDMFSEGKKNAPCIIFIDEIDAVGRVRGTGTGNEEREQTVNQLLVEMDGFDGGGEVIVIAATNRPDVLDPALLRPGRFDRQVVVSHPNIMGRERILSVHLRNVPVGPDVNSMVLARGTPGFSGADLAQLVNEAALLAVRSDHLHVTSVDFEQARDKVMMGAERRSLTTTSEEREMTAWHEAGHALVAFYLPEHDPLHKVSIVPRSRALGVTITLPERDRHSVSRKGLDSRIAMMFGGRVAEELIYGRDEVTTGASDDIRQATMLARRMVTEFGLSDALGPVYYESRHENFPHMSANVSPATELAIDKEIRRITERGRATARRILAGHMNELELLARALIERETLSGYEICVLLKGNLSERPSTDIESSPATRTIKAL